MRYLLDTNILSDLIRNPQGRITDKVSQVGAENICTSIVVAAELRYGAVKKQSARSMRRYAPVWSGPERSSVEMIC
jgi:tRNA(fMet)-specific endonuclease VapC